MQATTFLFYAFALVTVFSALRVITARNPVHSALFLVLIWRELRHISHAESAPAGSSATG